MVIINKKIDLYFIKFPIFLPLIFAFTLYTFPNYENILIFITLLFLAEPHFGATLPFFFNRDNLPKILSEKIKFIIIPILVILFSIIGFFYFYLFFILTFLAANFYHVTRQSYGICKLYTKDKKELDVQEFFIYFFNLLFFVVALNRFSINYLSEYNLIINLIIIISIILVSYIYIKKFKFSENYLTMLTGILIFFPVCFVSKPIHAIVMGVTMHYSQYLILTHKIVKNRNIQNGLSNPGLKFFTIILIYGILMATSSTTAIVNEDVFRSLIVIPLVGQMFHFYIDSNLWKFSDKHHRDVTLKHLLS